MSDYPQVRRYPPSPIGPIAVSGQFFTNAGQPYTGIMTSDFTSLKRYLEGQDIRPLLDERRAIGFNELRQWLLNESVVGQVFPGGIQPSQYPDFYERTRAFWELCGDYGFAIEATAFTSCIPLMPNRDDQVKHWQRTQDAARGLGHVRLELVNEYDWGQGQNAPDKSLWSMKPVGIVASSGSSTADAPPPEPVWDYASYHSNGLNEWQRKCAHNPMADIADKFKIAATANENTRYADDDSSTTHAYDAAAGAALLCAGACYHSQAGKYSRFFDAAERAGAEAWVAGARSVPLEFQRGVYHHRTDLEGGDVIRAYDRQLPDGRAHVVLIHA